MLTSHINIKSRPLKIAFVIDANDKASFIEAIQINSVLSGGIYNPIIPHYQRRPRLWSSAHQFNAKKILHGYLEAYDPDLIVCNSEMRRNIDTSFHIESPDNVLRNIDKYYAPNYGIGIFDILNLYYRKEGKFVCKNPLEIQIPSFDKQHELFLSAIFGFIPKNVNTLLAKEGDKAYEIKRPKILINKFLDNFEPSIQYPTRITAFCIQSRNPNLLGGREYVFLLDASNLNDIIDFWNIRALGCNVLPIPVHITNDNSVISVVREFIKQNQRKYKYVESVEIGPIILKARSLNESILQDFNTIVTDAKIKGKYIIQYSFPDIWNLWSAKRNGYMCHGFEYESCGIGFNDPKQIILNLSAPEIAKQIHYTGHPKYAYDLSIRASYDNKVIYPGVIPDGGNVLAGAFKQFGHGWRCSRGQLTHQVTTSKDSLCLTIPESDEIFSCWMRSQKFQLRYSTPGLLAKNIFNQIDGFSGVKLLAQKNILDMINDMNSGRINLKYFTASIANDITATGKARLSKNDIQSIIEKNISILDEGETRCISSKKLTTKLNKIIKINGWKISNQDYLKQLTDHKILTLGMEVSCTHCNRRSWLSLNYFNYEVKCSKCNNLFSLPQHMIVNSDWSFSPVGSLRHPQYASGSFTVLLLLRFFSELLSAKLTSHFSFIAKNGTREIEADLAFLYQKESAVVQKPIPFFAECKSFNDFQEKDIERMDVLARLFPDSFLVFASLKESFSPTEKKLFKSFSEKLRAKYASGRSYNHIILLNGNELFSPYSCLIETWRNCGDSYKKYADSFYLSDIENISDATLAIHLGLPPLTEFLLN